MEKEEIQELIRSTITEMLSELDQNQDQPEQHQDQPEQHQDQPEQHQDQPEQHEEQPSEMAQLRDEIKALKAAIHHANFLNAGSRDKPAPELTPEQIFSDLINPKKGENT